jgi:hypothetical protein
MPYYIQQIHYNILNMSSKVNLLTSVAVAAAIVGCLEVTYSDFWPHALSTNFISFCIFSATNIKTLTKS